MEEHTGSGHEPIPGLPSGTTGIVVRIALRALEKSGHEDLAKKIRESPDIVGDKIGELLLKLSSKKSRGEPITKQDEKAFATVIADNPKEAAKFLGIAIASAIEGALDVGTENQRILSSYSSIFGIICDIMGQSETSFALRGFIQASDCISYWHLKGPHPRFAILSDHIYPIDLEVYLLWADETTTETLEALNESILRNDRHLPPATYEHWHNDSVGLVKEVHALALRVQRLDPDREQLKKNKGPFDITNYDSPMDINYIIPTGAPSLVAMFDSLFEAIEIQGRHSIGVSEVLKSITEKKQRLPKLK